MKLSKYKKLFEEFEDECKIELGPDIIKLIVIFIPSFIDPNDYLNYKYPYRKYRRAVEEDLKLFIKSPPILSSGKFFDYCNNGYIVVLNQKEYFENQLVQIWKKPCQQSYRGKEMFCSHHNKKWFNIWFHEKDDSVCNHVGGIGEMFYTFKIFKDAVNQVNKIIKNMEDHQKDGVIIRKFVSQMCDG